MVDLRRTEDGILAGNKLLKREDHLFLVNRRSYSILSIIIIAINHMHFAACIVIIIIIDSP